MNNINQLIDTLAQSTLTNRATCELSVACIIAGYPILYEGLPGVGKTGLALKIAELLGLASKRLQCTPDIQPADIVGYLRPAPNGESFVMIKGPVFSQCLLVDEINRANPRAQSALLEAMAEGTVTLEGETQALPLEKVILATQNPQDQIGTFALPESQLDRFGMVLQLDYPEETKERALLEGTFANLNLTDTVDLLSIRKEAHAVNINDHCLTYLMKLIQATRQSDQFVHGLSTRGAKVLADTARAFAMIHHRDYVLPDDIQSVFLDVCRHRLVSVHTMNKGFTDDALLRDILHSVVL